MATACHMPPATAASRMATDITPDGQMPLPRCRHRHAVTELSLQAILPPLRQIATAIMSRQPFDYAIR